MFVLIPTKSDVLWFVFIFGLAFGSLKLSTMKDDGKFGWLAEKLAQLE